MCRGVLKPQLLSFSVAAIGDCLLFFVGGYGDSSVARALESGAVAGFASQQEVPIRKPSVKWSSVLDRTGQLESASCLQRSTSEKKAR